jgi:hypothetical protein
MHRLALASLVFFAACRPTYDEVRKTYAADYARAEKAGLAAWKAVDAQGTPDGDCKHAGLTQAVWGYDEVDQRTGNAEIISHLTLTLRYDKPRWDAEVKQVKLGSRFIKDSPLDQVANFARSTEAGSRRVWKGLIPTIEASRSTKYFVVVRGEGTTHLEAFLFDVEREEVLCGFAVDGVVSEGVEDRDLIVTDKSGSYRTSTNAEERSRFENAPRQLDAELKTRFGFGFEPAKKTDAVKPRPPPPPEALDAMARLASMLEQHEAAAPTCTGPLPEGTVRVDIGTLWWAAKATPPRGLGGFRTLERQDDLASLTNPFNPPSSLARGGKAFLAMKNVVVFEPVRFDAPTKTANGWSNATLHVRGLLFEEGKLRCTREWDLVTPDDLRVPLSHGVVTENSAREGAAKNLAEQLEFAKFPQ